MNSVDEEKNKLEKRLKKAFPQEWKILSKKKREFAIENFYNIVWPTKVAARETIRRIGDRGLSFALLFFGSALAILVGLVVNIIDRGLEPFGVVYEVAAPVALIVFIWFLNRIFENSIIDDYRNNRFLDELLEGYDEQDESQKKHETEFR